jgi:hypothetical protein
MFENMALVYGDTEVLLALLSDSNPFDVEIVGLSEICGSLTAKPN